MTDEKENFEPAPEASSDEPAEASTSESAPAAGSEEATPVAPETPTDGVAASEEAEPVAESEEAEPVAESQEAEPVAESEEAEADTASDVSAPEQAEPETAEATTDEPVAVDPTPIVEGDVEYVEETPREKPAIPGADLIPDIVAEGSDFLDAEARAAAEAEAEEAAARAAAEDPELVAKPIAEVAINLAAGARYTATGKRKTGVARVILKPGTGVYLINGKTLEQVFPRETLQRVIRQPLEAVGYEARMDVVARMHGGGVSAQAGALRHGIARALLEADPNLRGELKRRGFLTRDPRVKERKKAGLKKARKRPQFSKR